jgi:hypothetical protein
MPVPLAEPRPISLVLNLLRDLRPLPQKNKKTRSDKNYLLLLNFDYYLIVFYKYIKNIYSLFKNAPDLLAEYYQTAPKCEETSISCHRYSISGASGQRQ